MSHQHILLDIPPRPSVFVDLVTDGVSEPEIVIKQSNASADDCFDQVRLTYGEFRQIVRSVERNQSYTLSKKAAMGTDNG